MAGSVLFGEDAVMAPKSIFKDTKPLAEAFIFQELSRLPKDKLHEFVTGPEAKYLIENDIISGDTLEALVNTEFTDANIQLVVSHMAKENGDARWDEIVRHRAEERRLMNELISEYGDNAKTYAENYRENFVAKYVPASYLAD